jgi:galactokinase
MRKMTLLSQEEKIKRDFIEKFGPGGELYLVRAPGRVNLIGEHTDYNDGFVFPMALDFQITLAGRSRSDRKVKVYSADYQKDVEFDLTGPIVYNPEQPWSNYIMGVFSVLLGQGHDLPGCEIVFGGNIPQGSGLSSSAALEVATAVFLREISGLVIESPQLARLCQRAENEFVGMNCGIMDQFISMMARTGHVLLLDCRSLKYTQVPLILEDACFVVCHSGVKHALVDSEYNRRRKECESGVAVLQGHYPEIKALRDVNGEQLQSHQDELGELVYRRCRHVVTENERVQMSFKLLVENDLSGFGRLMNASHDSLRDDYQVSCPEIDLLVNLAREVAGVLGSRITGGGFGGCTISLVMTDTVEAFKNHIGPVYQKATGIEPRFYLSKAAGGAGVVKGGLGENQLTVDS